MLKYEDVRERLLREYFNDASFSRKVDAEIESAILIDHGGATINFGEVCIKEHEAEEMKTKIEDILAKRSKYKNLIKDVKWSDPRSKSHTSIYISLRRYT